MGNNYSIAATVGFQSMGLRQFTESGFIKNSKKWIPGELDLDLTGKTYIITGANSGIAYEAVNELASRNANVHMVCRSEERGMEALESLKQDKDVDIKLHIVDISRPEQVKEFGEKFVEEEERLDCLVNSAGVLLKERSFTSDNIETTFATNTLGGFLLTEYLLPVLSRTEGARVVNISSGGMYTQKMDPTDFQSTKGKFDGVKAYAQTKRQQICINETWADKYKDTGITFNSMHPGWASTPGTKSSLPEWFEKLSLRTPSQGADTIVYLAISKNISDKSGLFWFDREPVKTHINLGGTKSPEKDYDTLYEYCYDFKESLDNGVFLLREKTEKQRGKIKL